MNKSETGKLGENIACRYLVENGYKIIERNFRQKWGELDIIAKAPDKTLVFVEVKTVAGVEKLHTVKADKEKLRAALSNIFDNAIKYTPKGGVSVKVENGDNKVTIICSDTGIGITQEKLQNLFNRTFERGEQAKKTFATGSGLGLFLSNKIILGHDGKLWAESPGENQGSTFYIELPVG